MLQGLRAHLGIHPHDVVVTGEEQVQQALNGAAVAGPLRPAGRREKRGSAHSVQGSHSAWAIGCAQHWQQAQRQHALLARTARRSAPRGPAWGRGRPPASLPAPPSLRARRLRGGSAAALRCRRRVRLSTCGVHPAAQPAHALHDASIHQQVVGVPVGLHPCRLHLIKHLQPRVHPPALYAALQGWVGAAAGAAAR